MARDPAAPPRRTAYITPEGRRTLEAELERLWREERPRVTREVSEAAALGDRSENAEYIYGKKRLREIDRRLRWLSKRLDELVVVSEPPDDRGRVRFGAWVTLEDEDGRERRYRLVGPDESDAAKGRISVDSPLGRALLGRAAGEEVDVTLPRGRARYEVVAIEWEDDET